MEELVPTFGNQNTIELHQTPLQERHDILPEFLHRWIQLPDRLRYATDEQLRKEGNLDIRDERLRSNLWREVTRAANTSTMARIKTICDGVCSPETFKRLCTDDIKLAFYFSHYIPYESKAEALLERVADRYQELLSMDIMKKVKIPVKKTIDGVDKIVMEVGEEVDPKKAGVLLEVIRNLEERVKGRAVQRAVNINSTQVEEKPKYQEVTDINLLNDKLKMLEQRISGEVVDVTDYDELEDAEIISHD